MTDRRTQLLAATCRVIARHGMRGLRVEKVAAEANASTTLLYYYFGDRAGLITSAMEYVNERAGVYAQTAEGPTGYDRLLRQLRGEFQDDDEVRENSAVWGEIRGAAVFDTGLRPIVKEATDRWVADLAALVEEGQDDGSIAQDVDPGGLATRATVLVEGLSNRWLSDFIATAEARAHVATALAAELSATAPAEQFEAGNRR